MEEEDACGLGLPAGGGGGSGGLGGGAGGGAVPGECVGRWAASSVRDVLEVDFLLISVFPFQSFLISYSVVLYSLFYFSFFLFPNFLDIIIQILIFQ